MKKHDILLTKDNTIFGFRSSGVLNQDGKILIQRGLNDTVYALPGGHVAFGETSAETIVREYKEETGADIIAGRLIWVDESLWSWDGKDTHTVCFYHLLSVDKANTMPLDGKFKSLKTNDSELLLEWVDLTELKNIDLLPDFIKEKAANITDGIEHFVYRED
ncbi:NUDIX hydrolase [Eubacteriales bacterium OttesenSCG-928-G02]|nr:NUDIX hydrolase [Eubacteriales bacterium OttesenSCG-928-G02]